MNVSIEKEVEFFKLVAVVKFNIPPSEKQWGDYWESVIMERDLLLNEKLDELQDEIRLNLLMLQSPDQRKTYIMRLNLTASRHYLEDKKMEHLDDMEIVIDASVFSGETDEWIWEAKHMRELIVMSTTALEQLTQYLSALMLIEMDTGKLPNQSGPVDRLTHKQQILLLEKLGFFTLSEIKNMTAQRVGKLLAALLNRDEKNSYDYYRERYGTANGEVKSPANENKIESLLKDIKSHKK